MLYKNLKTGEVVDFPGGEVELHECLMELEADEISKKEEGGVPSCNDTCPNCGAGQHWGSECPSCGYM